MAWTYTTLKAAIQSYLEIPDEDNFIANLPVIIQQAEDRIVKSVQLPDFRKSCTGSLTANDQYLGIPPNFLAPYSLAVDADGYKFLLFKQVNFVRQAYPVAAITGVPKYYSIFDDAFFLVGPTPNTNYAVELHYFHRPDSIVTAGTSWLGDHAESALLYGCLVEAYTYTKGEADLLTAVKSQYDEALQALKILGEGRNTTDNYRNG